MIENPDLAAQVQTLQKELQLKEQEIQDLRHQLASLDRSLVQPAQRRGAPKGSPWIRVPGVSVEEVQRALLKAGLDAGAVDGRLGSKTQSAIKQFQRRKGLKPDGIIGEKTWRLLNS